MSYWHPDFHANPGRIHPALLAHHEQPRHRLVSDPVNVAPGGAVPPLTSHNGPTMGAIQVVSLYAGNWWEDKAYFNTYLAAVVEDGYLEPARGQGAQPGKYVGAFDIAPPSSAQLLDADCRTLLQGVVGRSGIPAPNPNTLFLLHLPAAVQVSFTAGGDKSCAQFCGYHSNDIFDGQPLLYAVHTATTCQGCFQTSPRVGYQMVLSHEIVEAATDPTGEGWFNDQTGEENADECAWVQDQYGLWINQGFAALVNGAWVNAIGTYIAPVPQPQHFRASGPAALAWQQLAAGGPLATSELNLLLAADPNGPAAPAWRYLLNGGDVQALLDAWGPYLHAEGAA